MSNHPLSVIFATPTLGQWADEYGESIIKTMELLGSRGIPFSFLKAYQKTFIGVARDQLATAFLANPQLAWAENLFWIDDDVGWPAEKVLEFLEAQEPILAGVPRLKKEGLEFPWNPVWLDLPSPDRSPEPLRVFKSNGRGMLAASMVPMGFCRMKRSALLEIARHSPRYQDDGKNDLADGGQILTLFPDGPDENSVHRGEDYAFCAIVRHFGVDIWVDPDIEFSHRGSYAFKGRLRDTL